MHKSFSTVALVLLVTMLSSCGSDGDEGEEPENASVTALGGNPARTGVMPGPPIDGAPELLWKVQVPGEGLSPLAVVDGTIYASGLGGYVVALDAENGEERWEATVEPWWASPPAVADALVYVTGGENLHAFDAGSGEERWRFPMRAGSSPSPLVAEGAVYVGSEDGDMYALDASSGEERWRSQVAEDNAGPATVVDGVIYVDGDSFTWALDAATGQEQWRFRKGEHTYPSVLAVNEGAVFLGDTRFIYSIDAATGEERWHTRGDEGMPLPAVAHGLAYFGHDGLFALDTTTGDMRWSVDMPGDASIQPVVVGDTLYVGGRSLYALDARTGEEFWHFDLDDTPEESDQLILPTVADGVIYAAVCLHLAYETGCQDDSSYVYAIGGTGEPPEGEARLSPQTPAPTATASMPPTPAHRDSGATSPVLIDSPGTWTLRDLGYSDVWLDRDSGTLVESDRPPISRRYSDPILYALPPGASQGPDLSYTLHFHFEIVFHDDIDAEDRGHQELTVTVKANLGTNVMVDFDTVRQGDSLVVECIPECPSSQRREGDKIIVNAEMWYSNGIPNRGVLRGVNELRAGIPGEDLPPRFEALHIFDDTYIEVTSNTQN